MIKINGDNSVITGPFTNRVEFLLISTLSGCIIGINHFTLNRFLTPYNGCQKTFEGLVKFAFIKLSHKQITVN